MNYRRYVYLALATVAMLMAGIMYNFTVFTEAIASDFGVEASTVSLVFSLSQVCFFLGGLVLGFIYKKFKPQVLGAVAAILMSLGLYLSSHTTAIWQLLLTYSILMNFAAGCTYKGVLAAVVPWFSDNLGVATGVMMMGAGLTAFVFNVPVSKLIMATNWRFAMMILSLVSLVLTLIPAVAIQTKPEVPTSQKKETKAAGNQEGEYTTAQMLKTSQFYLFFIWTVMLLAGCTSVTGNSVGLSRSIGLETAKAAVVSTVISVSNAISRIAYGRIYDKKGRKMAMGITTLFFVIGVCALHLALAFRAMTILIIAFVAIGFSFGGVPTIASTFVLRTFGRKNYASNFGVQGSYSLFSPLFGTTTFSLLYKMTGDYQKSYLQILRYAAISVAMYLVLNKIMAGKEKTR